MRKRAHLPSDLYPAMEAAERAGDTEALRELARHHFHVDHCGGWEVLAWPCPAASAVLNRLLSDAP